MADVLPPPPLNGGSGFAPHSEGVHAMLCVDVVDSGLAPDSYQGGPVKLLHKIALVFASGEQHENGELVVVHQEFTYSMGEKANLRKFLQQWRGKGYASDDEAAKVQLHKLEGAAALVTVEHKHAKSSGRTYAAIRSISPLVKGMTPPTITGYKRPEFFAQRKEDYAKKAAPYLTPAPAAAAPSDDFDGYDGGQDDDLPF